MANTGALAHIKVLDLSRMLPGPYCSMILADHGADVIAVEDRRYKAEGTYIENLYRNKKHMTLNLKTRKGKEILYRLLTTSDVFIEGFRPGVTKKLGIDYDTVMQVNPGIIYCSITGYGQTGCLKDSAGHDVNYISYAGLLDQVGAAGQPPVIPGVQIADIAGGAMNAAIGILVALISRGKSGQGQYVDISITDGALSLMQLVLFFKQMFGQTQKRGEGFLSQRYACYNTYETRDGKYLAIGAVENRFWKTLCQSLGVPEYAALQYDETRAKKITNHLRTLFKEKTLAQWEKEMALIDACWSPVRTFDEALEETVFKQREMVADIQNRDGEALKVIGIPVKLDKTPGSLRSPPAQFGENTEEILEQMGYSIEKIEQFKNEKIV